MNIYKLSGLTRLPMRLWRGFHSWRAMRKYARVIEIKAEAERLTIEADLIIARHVKPPMPLFEYGSDQDEQDHWMRGK